MRDRFAAVEADFQRWYQIDLGGLYAGVLRPLRVARLAAELPPGAGIFRGDDLDSHVYSLEAQLLRVHQHAAQSRKTRSLPSKRL